MPCGTEIDGLFLCRKLQKCHPEAQPEDDTGPALARQRPGEGIPRCARAERSRLFPAVWDGSAWVETYRAEALQWGGFPPNYSCEKTFPKLS